MANLVRVVYSQDYTGSVELIASLIIEHGNKIVFKTPSNNIFSANVIEKEHLDFITYRVDKVMMFKGGI